ncbi:phage late control D family protein [Iodobacter sp. BJB302]|uniref:phage late control D family protein n=1 Tax=Iodobacter sp. BJB302 TaxID=1506510 RepID=UPI000C0D970D|nr:contractile injection system protein, VgrG/Pvc8 family [Iodobacter sp. BJB302]PHV00159.1 phage protein D [Iodobacter sp. BJB302]
METLNTPAFELNYNGRNITRELSQYATSITYTDNLSGEADGLDIELEDTDGRWLNSWYPEKGAELSYRFGYLQHALISAGRFDIDELELSGPPSVVRIRALAAGAQKALRTRKGKDYEDTTLADIAGQIAKSNNMTLVGKIEPLQIDRATQYKEGDLAFLHRIARQYGYAFKVTENSTRLVFWKSADLHQQKPVRRFAPSDLSGWSFTDKVSDVPAGVEVSHHNAKSKKLVVYGIKDGETAVVGSSTSGKSSSADTVKITRRAPTAASAEVQAKAALDQRLIERTTGNINLIGDPALAAGVTIELAGFGQLSGIYTISKAVHSISRGEGYTTTLEIKRGAASKGTKGAKTKGLAIYGMKNGKVEVVDHSAAKAKKHG